MGRNRADNLKFGLYVPNFGRSSHPLTLTEMAVEAEKSGWDGFFLMGPPGRMGQRSSAIRFSHSTRRHCCKDRENPNWDHTLSAPTLQAMDSRPTDSNS